MMIIDLSTLNENQLDAVNWDEGPLLVLAGPGSGKTRVLTFRIARLIKNSPGKYFKILGLTFTNMAAAEMRDRIASLVPNASDRTLLTTFHSFAADLLQQHGHHVGLKSNFTILTQDADRLSLLDEAIGRIKSKSIEQTNEMLLPCISRLMEDDITPENALSVLERRSFDDAVTLALIYKSYRALMIEKNMLDFNGLIVEVLNLLKNHRGVRKITQQIYPYICVDEFQDTNLSQYKILQYLVNEKTKNVFVVADDDQIIYQWSGASPKRLWDLQKKFEMSLHQLPENYRCPSTVVDLANNLIAYNSEHCTKKSAIKAHKDVSETSVVTLKQFAQFSDEINWVAKEIAGRTPNERTKCVVLARTRKLLVQIVEALDKQGIAGYLMIRKNEFVSASLQWFHSILRLANSRTSREHLQRTCKAFFTLEGINLDIHDIISHASAKDGDYLRSWAIVALSQQGLSPAAKEIISESVVPILLERLDFWGFQDKAFTWLDGLPDVEPDDKGVLNEYQEEKETWYNLVNEISEQYGKQKVTLHLLLQELDLRSKSPVPSKDAIPCYTIHASKGMGFDHVYLVGMVEDQLPSWAARKKGEDSIEMQEERRNCFVAITRTQETLTLTYSDYIQDWRKQPSRFLYEMGLLSSSFTKSMNG